MRWMRLPPAGSPFRYLNVPVAWATQLAFGVDDRGLAERERHGAVQPPAGGDQPAEARPHEARLHLDRDHARALGDAVFAGAARRVAIATSSRVMRDAAVGHAPRVRELGAQLERDLGLAALEAQQLEAEQVDERDLDLELHGSVGLRPR